MSWAALESDPEIFTNYFRTLGLTDSWQFAEVFTLEDEVPCTAIVLTYRSQGGGTVFEGTALDLPHFIKQMDQLDNSCGLLAGLHAVLNTHSDVHPDSLLTQLKQGITDKTPQAAAQWLIAHQGLNDAHRLYAAQGQSSNEGTPNFHFVTVLPGLKLLDGMKDAPLQLAGDRESLCAGFFSIVRTLLDSGSIGEDMSMMVLQRVDA